MIPAVAYIRYSSDNQKETSLSQQENEIRDYAKRNNLNIIKVYSDKALSGRTADTRPAFLQMIEDAKLGTFEVIVCWNSSRFSRSMRDSYNYIYELEQARVRLEFVTETIPSADDPVTGIMTGAFHFAMNEIYSRKLSIDTLRGMRQNAEAARWNGSGIPLGLRKNKEGKLEPCPETSGIVRKVFLDFDRGKSIKVITEELNEAKITNSRGNPFKPNTVVNLLKRVQYKGTASWGGIVIENAILPQIIETELWDRVQQKLNSKKHKRITSAHNFMLTGKLFCAHCKSMMVGTSGTSRTGAVHSYYMCQKKQKKLCSKRNVRQRLIEDLLVEEANNLLTDDAVKSIAKAIVECCNEQNDSPYVQQLYRERADIQEALANLAIALEKGREIDFTLDLIEKKRAEEKDINERIAKEENLKMYYTEDDVVRFLEYLRTGDIKGEDYRQTIIDTLVSEVYLYDSEDNDNDRMIAVLNVGSKPLEISTNLREDIENALSSDKAFSREPTKI